jgi:hypothetical protein
LAEIDSQEGYEAATFELTYSTTASISSLFPAPETLILCIIQVPDHIIRMAVRSGPRVYRAIQIHAKIPGDHVGRAGI